MHRGKNEIGSKIYFQFEQRRQNCKIIAYNVSIDNIFWIDYFVAVHSERFFFTDRGTLNALVTTKHHRAPVDANFQAINLFTCSEGFVPGSSVVCFFFLFQKISIEFIVSGQTNWIPENTFISSNQNKE